MPNLRPRSNSVGRTKEVPNSTVRTKISRPLSLTSPDHSEDSLSKKTKSNMEALTNLVLSMKNEVANMNSNLNAKLDNMAQIFSERMTKVEQEMSELRNELSQEKKKTNEMNEEIAMLTKRNRELMAFKNASEQNKYDNQIAIMDLSIKLSKEQFIHDMKVWAGDYFKESAIKWINLRKYKNKSSTAYVHFWNVSDKVKFMSFVRSKQFIDNKYSPITNECIFKLAIDDTSKPNAINFRTPLTQITRETVNEARKLVKIGKIEKCMIVDGYVHIKLRNQNKMVIVESLEHLATINSSFSMETE